MLWLFCRRCAGMFKSPVIVALRPYCQGKHTHPLGVLAARSVGQRLRVHRR